MKPVCRSLTETLRTVCHAGGVHEADSLQFNSPENGRIHTTYITSPIALSITSSVTFQFVLQQINTAVITDLQGLIKATNLGFRHKGINPAVMPWPATDNSVLKFNGEAWIRRAFIEGRTPAMPINGDDLRAMAKALHQLHHSISTEEFQACQYNSVNPWSNAAEKALKIRLSDSTTQFSNQEQIAIARLQSASDRLATNKREQSETHKSKQPSPRSTATIERVVHRDTKPSNFIRRPDNTMVLIDFDTLGLGDPAQDIGELIRALLTEGDNGVGKIMDSNADTCAAIRSLCAGYNDSSMTLSRILLASQLSCLWQCQRYLNDHLAGDIYYSVSARGENLHNAIKQLNALKTLQSLDYMRSN